MDFGAFDFSELKVDEWLETIGPEVLKQQTSEQ
jgi:hypothetical protein